ncbi:hypothetical protein [Carnobacterium divergens]|uniref:hypothetical protein n=1 Tax=Carnobacterium divergens TaxID=2748 RepID=UPI001072586A|nr:hypothetical protein [Carnobacterium divergens]MPQ22185.1 hypothetical protein [Carnobacterium divergens]TFI75532.1 hypothetical protein CKN81_01465 [Carnobacterium divergens]
MIKNKKWIMKEIKQHLWETEGESYTGYEAGIDFVKALIEEAEPQLNENQQIVLGWLKAYADSDNGDKPISSIGYMMHFIRANVLEKSVRNAYFELTRKQQIEVLQAFAEWGLNHDRN